MGQSASKPEDIVYLSISKGCYHTKIDCPNLKHANQVLEKTHDEIPARLPLCKMYAGKVSRKTTEDAMSTQRKLLSMDPVDVSALEP